MDLKDADSNLPCELVHYHRIAGKMVELERQPRIVAISTSFRGSVIQTFRVQQNKASGAPERATNRRSARTARVQPPARTLVERLIHNILCALYDIWGRLAPTAGSRCCSSLYRKRVRIWLVNLFHSTRPKQVRLTAQTETVPIAKNSAECSSR